MKKIQLAILLVLMALPALAFAEVPGTLPVQGVLTDADGNPITDNVAVTFTIYGTAGDASATVHSETIAVDVDRGFFSVALGAGSTPLDLNIFKDGARELGITVGSDAEMSPRLEFGVTPFAAHAGSADDATTFDGNTTADFVGAGQTDSVTTDMVTDGAITAAKLDNPQTLYRVTSAYCANEIGTLMTTNTCRATQHNVDSCTNTCPLGQTRVRDCNGDCTCATNLFCIVGQPCDHRRSHPRCNNAAVAVSPSN